MTTEKVTTVWDWDTKGIVKGAQQIDRAYAKEEAARKRAQRAQETAQRNMERAQKRQAAFFAGAAAVGAYRFYAAVSDGAEEATRKNAQLEQSLKSLARTIRGSTSSSELTAAGGDTTDIQKQLSEKRERLKPSDGTFLGDLGSGYRRAVTLARNPWALASSTSIDDLMAQERGELDMQGKLTSKLESKRATKTTAAFRGELADAESAGPGGDPMNARLRAVDLAEQEARAKMAGTAATAEDYELMAKRYSVARETLRAEKEIAAEDFRLGGSLAGIQGGAGSAFSKSLRTSNAELRSGNNRMPYLDAPGRRAQTLKNAESQGQINQTIMGRYLNPNGTQRGEGEINADFRDDARVKKSGNRILGLIASGAIDPTTGKRANVNKGWDGGGKWDGGGSWGGGGTWDAPGAFPRKALPGGPPVAPAANPEVTWLEKIFNALPKETL